MKNEIIVRKAEKEDAVKYAGFINSGYQIIINDYLARASQAKTFEERHNPAFIPKTFCVGEK